MCRKKMIKSKTKIYKKNNSCENISQKKNKKKMVSV
jgi:hypothetical protein